MRYVPSPRLQRLGHATDGGTCFGTKIRSDALILLLKNVRQRFGFSRRAPLAVGVRKATWKGFFLLRLMAGAVLLLAVEHVVQASAIPLSRLKPLQIVLLTILGALDVALVFSPADILWVVSVSSIAALALLRWRLMSRRGIQPGCSIIRLRWPSLDAAAQFR